jgi:tRNA 2-thiouridine synthesizing protein A
MLEPGDPVSDAEWDAADMGCGELVLELRARLAPLAPGQVLALTARDPGARADIPAWCRMTGHTLVSERHPLYLIRKEP